MKEQIISLLAALKSNSLAGFIYIYNFFKEFYLRLKAKTPAYLIKIRTICITLTGIAGSLTAAGVNFTIWGLDIPKVITILGVISSIIASLGVEDPAAIKQQVQN